MNKNFVFFFFAWLLSSITANVYAETYRPFIEEGKVWKTGWVTSPEYPATKIDYYYLGGDTILKGKEYRKLMRTNVTKEGCRFCHSKRVGCAC